jgi:DNA-3-methyladenine glycosylase II
MRFTLKPDGPFSLAAAAEYDSGQILSRSGPAGSSGSAGSEKRLAFVTDDMYHHAAAHVTQDRDGVVSADIQTDADPGAAWRQVLRMLSLDGSAAGWTEVCSRDPVLGGLQARYAGLRPVLFHSPYEATAWSIISARRYRGQAAAIRQRLSAELGRTFTIAGEEVSAFPLPHRLLKAETLRSVAPQRVRWLQQTARAALDGALDPEMLRALGTDGALARLRLLPGIGPGYGTMILERSTGVTDALTLGEPRLPEYVAYFYETGPGPAGREELERISRGWRPFRTWAAIMIRVAGDRLDLPAAA